MNHKKTYYGIRNGGHERAIVFIHGLFLSHESFEKSVGSIKNHTSVFIDLFALSKDSETYDLSALAREIVSILDHLAFEQVILVSKGIGRDLAFKIGLERPNLIKGEVFIGSFTGKKNPMLKDAELKVYEHLRSKVDLEVGDPLVNELFNFSNVWTDGEAQEFLDRIKHDAFLELFKNIDGENHFSKKDYRANTIPNVFLIPDDTSESQLSLVNQLGFNKHVLRIKNTRSDAGVVRSRSFTSELRKSLSYF